MMGRLILKICIGKCKSLPRDENGAAMMITLAVILFLYLLCSATYAIGMTINEKIQLQNACDAAAYSAAVVEADGLSRIATINRAMSWTYIQTVKRRMDYIVLEWLNLTRKRFGEDEDACKKFNFGRYNTSQPNFILLRSFDPVTCSMHTGTRGPGRWWVGWTENDDKIRLGYVTKEEVGKASSEDIFQYGRFIPCAALKDMPQIKNYNDVSCSLKELIKQDDEILNELTVMLTFSIYSLNERMEIAALDMLRRNLPENSGLGDEEYFYRILLPNFSYPYPDDSTSTTESELLQGVLSAYRNTEEDELEFLSASVDNSSFHNIFGDGIDQWFIRGRKTTLCKDDISKLTVPQDDYVMRGIQRGYKSANREEGAIAGAVEALRGNHVAYGKPENWAFNHILFDLISIRLISDCFVLFLKQASSEYKSSRDMAGNAENNDITPSCINSNNLFIEQCLDEKNNYGLVAEYHWCSLKWWCGFMQRWRPSFFGGLRKVGPPEFKHYKVSSIISCCYQHASQNPGSKKRVDYKQCYVGKDMLSAPSVSTHGSSNQASGYMTMGYSRIYGDDKAIYDPDYYITPKVMPVKLNRSFFQERINVAVARKHKNPFRWMFSVQSDDLRSVAPAKSIYSVFDPTLLSGDKSGGLIVATSSATAAFRSRIKNKADSYETKYDQLTSFEYDKNFHSDTPTIELSNNVSSSEMFKMLRMGCPHKVSGNRIAERLGKTWNLCETDWQAVFVPQRYADDNWLTRPYDSLTNNGEQKDGIAYREYPAELTANSNFIMGICFPDENGIYLRPLYDRLPSTNTGIFLVRHPAGPFYCFEDLAVRLWSLKLH